MEITIFDKKSNVYNVRGVIWTDGTRIPFTAYRHRLFPSPETGQWDAPISFNHVAVRSKSGILSKFDKKDFIKGKIRDAAKGWWIDHKFWRV